MTSVGCLQCAKGTRQFKRTSRVQEGAWHGSKPACMYESASSHHNVTQPHSPHAHVYACGMHTTCLARQMLHRTTQWLTHVDFPRQAEHAVLVARLTFVLLARSPRWAAGPDEWNTVVNNMLQAVERALQMDNLPHAAETIAAVFQCLMVATRDLGTFEPEAGRTRGGLNQRIVDTVTHRLCQSVATALCLPPSETCIELRQSAVEACVDIPQGKRRLLLTARLAPSPASSHPGGKDAAAAAEFGNEEGRRRHSAKGGEAHASGSSALGLGDGFPFPGAKVTSITERHWDPDMPGKETVKVWRRDDDEADDAGQGGEASDSTLADHGQETTTAHGGETNPTAGTDVDVDDGVLDMEVLEQLVAELDVQTRSEATVAEPYTGALLAVLSALAADVSGARRFLKNRLMPRTFDRSKRPDDGDSLRARLARNLRGDSTLLWWLCMMHVVMKGVGGSMGDVGGLRVCLCTHRATHWP